MKTLFRILIVATTLGIVYYYSVEGETSSDLLEGTNQVVQPLPELAYTQPKTEVMPRPLKGLSMFINRSSKEILEHYGTPNRVDQTAYGYEWWIYNSASKLLMVSVYEGKVTQVYTNVSSFEVTPYEIGQSLDDIYRMTIFEQEVSVEIDENIYMLAMNEEDMHRRILVKYDGVYAQLYINEENKKLDGIRFLNGETLVLHKPYELQFVGELLESSTPSSFVQLEINLANGYQLTDLVNAFRQKNELPPLQQNSKLNTIASANSEDMFLGNMMSHESPTYGLLQERLDSQNLGYKQYGQNIAADYVDVIEVVHGWINSPEHRKQIDNEAFTHIGSGAFVNYFTQVYTETNN